MLSTCARWARDVGAEHGNNEPDAIRITTRVRAMVISTRAYLPANLERVRMAALPGRNAFQLRVGFDTDQAKRWLGKALLVASDLEEVDGLRQLALEDPDLEPLRKMP